MSKIRIEVLCQTHTNTVLARFDQPTLIEVTEHGAEFLAGYRSKPKEMAPAWFDQVARRQRGKHRRRCPMPGCHVTAEFDPNKVHALLLTLFQPGLNKTWRVTNTEMVTLVRQPDLAPRYLAEKDARRLRRAEGR